MTTDVGGVALSPPLEIRAWQVTTRVSGYEADTRSVSVVADTSTDVAESLTQRVINTGVTSIIGTRNLTTSDTQRSRQFIQDIPATRSNPQNFPRLLLTVPGFIESSVNVVHPRGEHASTAIYINGFQLPGVLQGRAADRPGHHPERGHPDT